MKPICIGYSFRALIRLITVIIIIIVYSPPSSADVLRLVDGDRITGRLNQLSPSECIFATNHQAILRIKTDQIKEMDTDSIMVVEMESGERLFGQIRLLPDGVLTIESSLLGPIQIPILKVVTVQIHDIPKNTDDSDSLLKKKRLTGDKLAEDSKESPKDSKHSLGKKEEGPPQTFLRDSAVLLAPGQAEANLALSYEPRKVMDYFQRVASATWGLNFGILNRLEGWARVPLGYAWMEENSAQGRRNGSDIGTMDVSGGLRYQLMGESESWPETVTSLSLTAPTGASPYQGASPSLGDGHWKASLGLSFVKAADPAILFWGISYTYYFPRDHLGHTYEPSGAWNYFAGMGFAINERLTASGRFSGGYKRELFYDGREIAGSSLEPLALSLGLSYRAWGQVVLEPMITFGLNSDAGDAALGLTISRKF